MEPAVLYLLDLHKIKYTKKTKVCILWLTLLRAAYCLRARRQE
jgi:hypothetical protein